MCPQDLPLDQTPFWLNPSIHASLDPESTLGFPRVLHWLRPASGSSPGSAWAFSPSPHGKWSSSRGFSSLPSCCRKTHFSPYPWDKAEAEALTYSGGWALIFIGFQVHRRVNESVFWCEVKGGVRNAHFEHFNTLHPSGKIALKLLFFQRLE